jgi:hypothetical protein
MAPRLRYDNRWQQEQQQQQQQRERRGRRGGGSDLFEARSGVPEVVLVLRGHVAETAVPYAAGADDMIRARDDG